MAALLLDTSVIIHTINEKKNRRQFLHGLVQDGNILACCAINVAEIYAGMRLKEEAKTTHFLASLDYYPVTFSVARLAGELKRDFGRKGTTLSLTDSLIAAVAIPVPPLPGHGQHQDFPMKDLHFYPLPNEK
jgi:predicted nucleic acid-binding protein